MSEQKIFKEMATALILLNLFDVFATFYLLNTGQFYESTDWLAFLYERLGYINSIAMIKFWWAIMLAYCVSHYKQPSPVLMLLMTFATSTYTCLMFWHLYLFSFTTRIL